MRIAESQISMSSQHDFSVSSQKSENLTFFSNTGSMTLEKGVRLAEGALAGSNQDTITISEEAKELSAQAKTDSSVSSSSGEYEFALSEKDRQKVQLLETFLSQILGKKVKLHVGTDLRSSSQQDLSLAARLRSRTVSSVSSVTTVPSAGWGLSYDYSSTYQESESLSYSSQGTIRTSDGKEISFDLNMNLSRSYYTEQRVSLKLGDANKIDPLIINLDVPSAGLSNLKVDFDLNADGTKEQISFLAGGSGFLALDKNQDGTINDGKELFGPTKGDGFSELSDYDSDGNSWIDENDAIFDQLSVWTKDENGKDQLLSLAKAGVGAIYLGHQTTDFTYKDNSNEGLAELKSTGIYLKESGSVGTIQHIDYII